MPRPDWRDLESYRIDPKSYSYRAYAWEFLRRNLTFQSESTVALEGNTPRQWETVATKYGLRELIWYTEPYDPGESEFFWLAEALCEPPFVHEKGARNVLHHLRPGEVALVFDLDATVGSGPASITAFLQHARKLLIDERIRYLKSLPSSNRKIRFTSPRIRKSKLLTYLRTYDAVVHAGVTQKAAAQILYPNDFVPDAGKKTKARAAETRISADLAKAKQLVESEYLALIPLDYLQDKSKR